MVFEHALLALKKATEDFVPDEPHAVSQLRQRHDWLEQKVFRGLVADEDDHLKEQAELLDLAIHPNPANVNSIASYTTVAEAGLARQNEVSTI